MQRTGRRTKIEERMAFTRDNYRMMGERLLQIVYWEPDTDSPIPISLQKPPYKEDVIETAKTLSCSTSRCSRPSSRPACTRSPIDVIAERVDTSRFRPSCARLSS
jgi:hypothetical protein